MESNQQVKRKHVFVWKIEKYSMCAKKKDEKLTSPTFKAKSFDDTAWCLELFPRGKSTSDVGYTSCYLNREEDAFPFAIVCDFMIELITKNGSSVMFSEDSEKKFEKGQYLGWRNYMKTDDLLKTAVFDDTLIIRCTLSGYLPEKILYSKNSSITRHKTTNYSFEWVVKNLETAANQEFVKFQCTGPSHLEITLQIPETGDDVKICFRIAENSFRSQYISCSIILLDVEGKERGSRRATRLFENTKAWEFPNFIKKSHLNAESDVYLKDGCFTLRCDVSLCDGSVVESTEEKGYVSIAEKVTSATDTVAILNENIKRMYTDKIHTDIKLKARKEVFPAHKCILCARSPVFLAMFDNDMAENQKGEVDIPDLDAKTMGLFLEYIYNGTVFNLDYENALKLIVAADKYQVLSLKNMSADLLGSMLSDANVCQILLTADLVQHSTLKASAIDFIKLQPKKILNLEMWKDFVKNNVLLAIETTSKVAILLGDHQCEQSGK